MASIPRVCESVRERPVEGLSVRYIRVCMCKYMCEYMYTKSVYRGKERVGARGMGRERGGEGLAER